MNALKFAIPLVILIFHNQAFADIVSVSGTSNIFASGSATIPPGAGDDTVPPSFSFAPANNLVLRFSSVTGSVGADVNFPTQTNGPDGGIYSGNIGTNVNSTAGISGIIHTNFNMFLTGFFLSSLPPTTAPVRLSFSQPEDFLTLSPQLGQSFFIGDGRTDTGSLPQAFLVPQGASRLYFGFVDAADTGIFQGNPGFYFDKIGSITADFTVTAVPEPSSAILLASVAGLVLLVRRKKRKTNKKTARNVGL